MSHRDPISFLQSLRVAARGIREAVIDERNLRTHLVVTAIVLLLGVWLRISRTEWGLILLCIGLVLSVELLNTAIENVVNLVSPEYHELARKAKDIAAGAVLTVTVMAILIGVVIFLPPLIHRICVTTGPESPVLIHREAFAPVCPRHMNSSPPTGNSRRRLSRNC